MLCVVGIGFPVCSSSCCVCLCFHVLALSCLCAVIGRRRALCAAQHNAAPLTAHERELQHTQRRVGRPVRPQHDSASRSAAVVTRSRRSLLLLCSPCSSCRMGCGASSAAADASSKPPVAAAAQSPDASPLSGSPTTTSKGGVHGAATTIPPSPTMDAVVAFVPEPNTPVTPGRQQQQQQQTALMTPTSAATTSGVVLANDLTSPTPSNVNTPRDAAGSDGKQPAPVSRQSSVADVAVTLSRQHSTVAGADAEVSAVTSGAAAALAPPSRGRTGRRASHNAHHGAGPGENDWRNPKHAAELVAAQLAEDPHAFRDHVALYWRLENMPPVPPPATPSPSHAMQATTATPANSSRLHQPHPIHPSAGASASSGVANGEGRVLVLHPSASSAAASTTHATPPPAAAAHASAPPSSSPAPSTPPILPLADQVSVFLSLGPSSGAGDKIGSSESRPLEKSIAFYPMLLPYSGLNDPNFSMQVQVWQKRVVGSASIAAMGQNHGVPFLAREPILSLLGYVDVSILHLFSSFEKSQGLLLKPAPLSALPPGTLPTPLPGSMIVVDYIQFYIHTTAAVGSSRWPKQLASPQSDCLWRAQMQALKLAPPRGCPHPNMQGSMMSPAMGAIIASGLTGSASTTNLSGAVAGSGGAAGLAAAAAAASGAGGVQVGACFFQIFKGVYPERAAVAATSAPSLGSAAASTLTVGATNEPSPSHALVHSAAPSPVFGATGTGSSAAVAGPPLPSQWTLVHTSEFVSLSRYPKFLEFQRPIADICEGSYNEVALLIQMVLTHDNLTPAVVARIMPPGCTHSDPAAALTAAVKAEGMTICSLVQSVTCMRELLQGKTKLRLHAPGEEGSASGPAFGRASTFTLGGSVLDGLSDGGDHIAAASSGPHGPSGAGTLAFSISQIFSSRASLEALARLKIARVTKHSPPPPPLADGSAPATPVAVSDGFDEAGVIRSTAYLASLLPAPQGRRHHRPGSHLRGPSALGGGALDLSPSGGPLSHGHAHGHAHGHHSGAPPHPPQRSKTLGSLSGPGASGTLSPIASAIDEGGSERGGGASSASALGDSPTTTAAGSSGSAGSSSSGMAALLQRMGLQKPAPVNNRVSLDQGAANAAAAAASKRRSM